MRIVVITGSRADWNGLGMVAKVLRERVDAFVNVIAIGQHAHDKASIQTIVDDGFLPAIIDLGRGHFPHEIAALTAHATERIAGVLAGMQADMVLVVGDRYEILGAVTAAAIMRIPVAHIGGGDITEGSIDNRLRFAISALSDLHFVTNASAHMMLFDVTKPTLKSYFDHKVCLVGNPALDRMNNAKIVSHETLFESLGIKPSAHNILVAYHAATTEQYPVDGCLQMIAALEEIEASYLVLGTNEDNGSAEIDRALRSFTHAGGTRAMHSNLSPAMFYSVLTHFDCMVGNSSAGLIETPFFGIPVVNIGPRQTGRTFAPNVQNCPATKVSISAEIWAALASGKLGPLPNPYGDGHSAPRIARLMMDYLGGKAWPES